MSHFNARVDSQDSVHKLQVWKRHVNRRGIEPGSVCLSAERLIYYKAKVALASPSSDLPSVLLLGQTEDYYHWQRGTGTLSERASAFNRYHASFMNVSAKSLSWCRTAEAKDTYCKPAGLASD